jgi:hypothetical protein
MVAITAVPTNDTHSPYVTLTITGLTVGVDFTVIRIDNTSEYPNTAIRGLDTKEATATSDAGTDYEAWIGRSMKYRVTQGVSSADSSNVDLTFSTFGDVWLRSVSTPALSRKVVMSEWPTTEHTTNILANMKVLGRKNPVLITDAWGTRKGSLRIVTDNDDGLGSTTWQEIYALLTGGGTILLQTTGRTPTGQEDMYFEVESYSRTRVGKIKSNGRMTYLHDISYIEVDRPATIEESLGVRNYSDVQDENATYQVIVNDYTTYLTLLTNSNPPGG